MRVVLANLKEHSFYFIDSYTARGSQGLATAQELGVPAARRHIFLDNVQETETICRQIDELVAIAQKKGAAIAIGHPLGCSGARLALTVARELRRHNKKYAVISLCIGVGQGLAMVIENVS